MQSRVVIFIEVHKNNLTKPIKKKTKEVEAYSLVKLNKIKITTLILINLIISNIILIIQVNWHNKCMGAEIQGIII